MKNHSAAVSLAGAAILCAALLLGGCKRSEAPSALGPADENARLLQQIKQFQEESGKSLAWLTQEVEKQKAASVEQSGDPAVVRELAVARFTLRDAVAAATATNATEAAAALVSLQRTLEIAKCELPSAQIARHVDRAYYIVRSQAAAAQTNLTAASLELQAATNAAVNGRPAVAVPDVVKDLETAKAATDRGDGEAARAALTAVLKTITEDPLAKSFAEALAAVQGAQQALVGRPQPAWRVIEAELAELGDVLATLADTLSPQAKTAAAPAASPAATPPAAGATEGAAVPQAPAVQPEASPQTPATPPAGQTAPSTATPPATGAATAASPAAGSATPTATPTAPSGGAAATPPAAPPAAKAARKGIFGLGGKR